MKAKTLGSLDIELFSVSEEKKMDWAGKKNYNWLLSTAMDSFFFWLAEWLYESICAGAHEMHPMFNITEREHHMVAYWNGFEYYYPQLCDDGI